MQEKNLEILNKYTLAILSFVTRLTFEIMCSNVYNENKHKPKEHP